MMDYIILYYIIFYYIILYLYYTLLYYIIHIPLFFQSFLWVSLKNRPSPNSHGLTMMKNHIWLVVTGTMDIKGLW